MARTRPPVIGNRSWVMWLSGWLFSE